MAEAGTARVWNSQIARYPAAEMTGIGSHHPRLRQQAIHCLAQCTRIYQASGGDVAVSSVVIAAFAHSLRGPLAPPTRGRPLRAPIKLGDHGLRRNACISKYGDIGRRMVAKLGCINVDLRQRGSGGDQLAVFGGPMREAHSEPDDEVTACNELTRSR